MELLRACKAHPSAGSRDNTEHLQQQTPLLQVVQGGCTARGPGQVRYDTNLSGC